MIVDRLENLLDCVSGSRWEKVAAFLRTLSAETPDGEYPIDGEAVYGRVMTYDTIAPSELKAESHEQYIDLQMSLRGCEAIDIFYAPVPILEGYDPKRDVALYDASSIAPVVSIFNRPGAFAIFYPHDIHRPRVHVAGEASSVKKVVVKVRID